MPGSASSGRSRLLRRGITQDLDGEVDLDVPVAGVVCRMIVALDGEPDEERMAELRRSAA